MYLYFSSIFMKENALPNSYKFGEKELTFGQIHEQFSSTQYGETLRDNIRFSLYKPESISNAEWRKALGADVNNLTHMPLTLGLTKSFLKHCANPDDNWQKEIPEEATFNSQEQEQLLLTGMVHDQGEGIITDIPLPLKTDSDEEREMIALRTVIRSSFNKDANKNNDISDQAIADDISDQAIAVLTHTNPKLGKAFNAIEHVGYLRTALRAWEYRKGVSEEVKPNLNHLAQSVFSYSISRLVDYSNIYPPVKSYLDHHNIAITDIFHEFEGNPSPVDEARLEKSKQAWGEFSTQGSSLF